VTSPLLDFLRGAAAAANPGPDVLRVLDLLDLSGLAIGQPTTLYHGTTASFREFDPAKCRRDLVDSYYGAGIFLTPSWDVAARYAWAARNAHLPASILDDLEARNGPAGRFFRLLHARHGPEVWEVGEEAPAAVLLVVLRPEHRAQGRDRREREAGDRQELGGVRQAAPVALEAGRWGGRGGLPEGAHHAAQPGPLVVAHEVGQTRLGVRLDLGRNTDARGWAKEHGGHFRRYGRTR
jgi:hypothetical protein